MTMMICAFSATSLPLAQAMPPALASA